MAVYIRDSNSMRKSQEVSKVGAESMRGKQEEGVQGGGKQQPITESLERPGIFTHGDKE